MSNNYVKRTPEIQDSLDALYDNLDELQEMVNTLLEENERLKKRTRKEYEDEVKECDTLYLQWFKEAYGVTPEEADNENDYI